MRGSEKYYILVSSGVTSKYKTSMERLARDKTLTYLAPSMVGTKNVKCFVPIKFFSAGIILLRSEPTQNVGSYPYLQICRRLEISDWDKQSSLFCLWHWQRNTFHKIDLQVPIDSLSLTVLI